MAKQAKRQLAGSGEALPAGVINNKTLESYLSRAVPTTGTWNVASGNFGTPPAGSYLMFLKISANNTAGLLAIGAIVNESGASVSGGVCQGNAAVNGGSGVDAAFFTQMSYYTTDGTKTLFGWFRSDGATTTVGATLILVRIA
jgi:hypothetical protein